MYREGQEVNITEAIFKEAEGYLPGPLLAVLKKMHNDQQAIVNAITRMDEGDKWRFERIDKQLEEIRDLVDPAGAEERKNKKGMCCDSAEMPSRTLNRIVKG